MRERFTILVFIGACGAPSVASAMDGRADRDATAAFAPLPTAPIATPASAAPARPPATPIAVPVVPAQAAVPFGGGATYAPGPGMGPDLGRGQPWAQTPPDPIWARLPWALETHLGLGTPVGALGTVIEYSPAPAVGIGVGAGIGSGPDNGSGVKGALALRLRPARGAHNALVVGAAYSVGGYESGWFEPDTPVDYGRPPPRPIYSTQWAHFAQLELGWERRAESGFLLRLSLGFAWLLNVRDLQCRQGGHDCAASALGTGAQGTLPTLDVTLGFAD